MQKSEYTSSTYKTPNMTDDARPDDVGVDWVVFSTNSIVEGVIYMYTK